MWPNHCREQTSFLVLRGRQKTKTCVFGLPMTCWQLPNLLLLFFNFRFKNRGFPLSSLKPEHFIGVGPCLQWITNSSSYGSFGDCVGERNHNLTMIWKCSGSFQGVSGITEDIVCCVCFARDSVGGLDWGRGRWRDGILGGGVSARWVSPCS